MMLASPVRFESDAFPAPALRLKRYSPYLGATASGLDLRRPITGELAVELRQALLDHGVLFFQEQELASEDLLAIARVFGTTVRHDGSTNATGRPNSPVTTLLYASKAPPSGGDPIWASSAAAYRALHPLLATYLETLTAINFADADGSTPFEVPIVTVHPHTGERSIFVNELHTLYIKGLTRVVSDSLLRLLFGVLADPLRHARFEWSRGSLAIWDNRLVQYRALQDYGQVPRAWQRLSIE